MSSVKALLEAKKSIDAGNFVQAQNIAREALQSDPANAALLYFLSSALVKSQGEWEDAYQAITQCKQAINPQNQKDEVLIPQINRIAIELFNRMLEQGNTNQKREAAGFKMQCLRDLTDFQEKKGKWDKYLEDVEELTALYLSNDQYADIEQLYFKLFRNPNITAVRRHQAAIAIFNFPTFYKPKTQMSLELIKEISALVPDSPENNKLFDVIILGFDKKQRFTFYETALPELPRLYKEYKEFAEVGSGYFMGKELTEEVAKALVQQKLSSLFKYLVIVTLVTEEHSTLWKDVTTYLERLTTTQSFQDLQSRDSTFPLFTLTNAILEAEKRVYSSLSQVSYLSKIKELTLRDKEIATLKKLAFQKVSPLLSLIYSEHLFISGTNFDEALKAIEIGLSYLKDLQAQYFVKGYEWEVKFLLLKMKILSSTKVNITMPQRIQAFQVATLKLKELGTTSANFDLVNTELPQIVFNFKMQWQGVKASREYLEELEAQAKIMKVKEDWLKSQKAWLTLSMLEEITRDKAEQFKIIEGILILLKEALTLNPSNEEALIRIGTLYYKYGDILGVPDKQASVQWLNALKLNQSNAIIFYSLGLYYHLSEKDTAKAMKCLDKALMLQPDLEEACILYYQILIEQGKETQALQILEAAHKQNPLLAFPYYFKGLRAQNQFDFQQARIHYENAARYHGFLKGTGSVLPNYPRVNESLEKRPSSESENLYSTGITGIFGDSGTGVIWLHLAECYLHLEKYPTAEKCLKEVFAVFNQAIPDLADHASQLINRGNGDGSILDDIKDIIHPFAQAGLLNDEQKGILQKFTSVFTQKSHASFQLDILQALLINAKVDLKLKNYHQALMFSSLGLESLGSSLLRNEAIRDQVLWEFITLVLESLLMLIDENLGGKADRKELQKKKYVSALTRISEKIALHQDVISRNESIARSLASSFKVIGEETKNYPYIQRAIEGYEKLLTSSNFLVNAQYKRGLKLDLARLYHLVALIFQEHDTQAFNSKKIQLVRQLIRENPSNGQYWVYHGIFQKEQDIKLQSFYKALQLDEKDQFALNNLLCLFLRQGQLRQALNVLGKLRDIESLNPLVVGLLVVLHARVALETSSFTTAQKKRHLQESISIGEMFLEIEQEKLDLTVLQITEEKVDRDLRLDIHQYLSSQMNYLVTIMQYEDSGNTDVVSNEIIEILEEKLKESSSSEKNFLKKVVLKQQIISLGSSSTTKMFNLVEKVIQNTQNMGDDQGIKEIHTFLKDLEEQDWRQQQTIVERYQNQFLEEPSDKYALLMISAQERFIQSNKVLHKLLIEELRPSDFKKLVDGLDNDVASKFVHQSLQLYFMKYPSNFDKLNDIIEILEDNKYNGALKHLPGLEYEKLFKLHLLNSLKTSESSVRLRIEMKRVMARGIQNLNAILEAIINEKESSLKRRYEQVMKHPSKLEGHLDIVWGLIKNGQVAKALNYISVIQFKLSNGIITEYSKEQEELLSDYIKAIEAISTKQVEPLCHCSVLSKTLVSLLKAFIMLIGGSKPDGKDQSAIIKNLGIDVVEPWLQKYSHRDEVVEDQMDIVYSLISKLFLRTGHLSAFNEMGEVLLSTLDGNSQDLSPFFVNEFKVFLMSNISQSLNFLGKKAAANKYANQVDEVIKNGGSSTKRFNMKLARAALKISANLPQDGQNLASNVEKESNEKQVLVAVSYFLLQEYKNFYLACIALVTKLKQELILLAFNGNISKIDNAKYVLGYSYYLKAKAEFTFFEARKQGITLKDDYSNQETKMFNAGYFKTKVLKSCQKSIAAFEGWKEVQQHVQSFMASI